MNFLCLVFSRQLLIPLYVTADGKCSNATGLQLPGVLDELFSYNAPLGALYSNEAVSLFLWAPTAQVCHIFNNIYYLSIIT